MSYLNQFRYQVYGPPDGRKWVFLHGLMGFLNNWRTIISHLEATECCLTFDQRGHGRSMKPETGYSPEDYAEDLKEILAELAWDQVILVGHSMGGRNALSFASKYPEKVNRLIIEDIAPSSSPDQWKYYQNLLGSVPTPFPSRQKAREFFQNDFKQIHAANDSVDVLSAYFYANLEDTEEGKVDWRFSYSAIIESVKRGSEDRWDLVKSLSVPTLWIRGENSRELKKEDWQKILQSNNLIQGVEISKAGHWVHSEQPLAFVKELKNFAGGFS